MAWLGRVSLGGFSDLAGAVTKLSESVKNIEKNFDSALGLEPNPEASVEASGLWQSASERISLFDPVISFVGQKVGETSTSEHPSNIETPERTSLDEKVVPFGNESSVQASDVVLADDSLSKDRATSHEEELGCQKPDAASDSIGQREGDSDVVVQTETPPSTSRNTECSSAEAELKLNDTDTELKFGRESHLEETTISNLDTSQKTVGILASTSDMNGNWTNQVNQEKEAKDSPDESGGNDFAFDGSLQPDHDTKLTDLTSSIPLQERVSNASSGDNLSIQSVNAEIRNSPSDSSNNRISNSSAEAESVEEGSPETKDLVESISIDPSVHELHAADPLDHFSKLDKANKEMKLMEAALQGAARQAQAKADEIAKLMNENEQLKLTIEDLKKKTTESDNDALREEYHQRVSSLERKVYALTKERDTLRREQSKKSDVTALLKEKDEIINQVMAEGENLSKKQAAQELTMRKLRAQIRELEEEKQKLNSKLQVEENKIESIKRDKAATEKVLQETLEKNQAELAAQKEFYTNALDAAKEAEALAEARANTEAKIELENRLREAAEREAMLVQTLEELRQTLTRTERQAAFREDMLQRDVNEVQQRYQASELRYNELITQVPESTRPLLRQIEAMQETAARKAEAWAGVEKSLNSRLEAAEAKAAASEEKERLINDRLSQALSRITILETQVACLRTENAQLNRSLEKERQRASENRQEYLAAMEDAANHEGRAKQLEEEIREIRAKNKKELQEELIHRELLEKELLQVKNTVLELQRNSQRQVSIDHVGIKHLKSYPENGNLSNEKHSSSGSLSSMEESFFLQASLDSSDSSDKRMAGETTISPYYLKSLTPSAFEAALRQKDGELASYMSRLASLESIRDSLSEELVNVTEQCEKLRGESALLPGIRAELEALRRRHSAALELMGERDEELEELRADIVDLKEMYREQIDLLINKLQLMGSSVKAGR